MVYSLYSTSYSILPVEQSSSSNQETETLKIEEDLDTNSNKDTSYIESNVFKAQLKHLFIPFAKDTTHYDIVYACLYLAPLWFLSNILYNYSLLMTSISSSTIIRYAQH